MKKRCNINLYILACGLLSLGACSNDHTFAPDISQVGPAPDFIDERDGHVYHCVQVGEQVWMAENLAYYLPGGCVDGCITWNEKQDLKEEDIKVDEENIVVVISDEEYKAIYYEVADDPTHDWAKEDNLTRTNIDLYFNNFYPIYGQEAFTQVMSYYPSFYALLTEKLEKARAAQREAYIQQLAAEKVLIPAAHRDKAEEANGGYVEKHGYLYSHDGALKAVPADGGWRLPTDADWKNLETALGMSHADADRMNAWRGEGLASALVEGGATGFNVLMSGCNAYQLTNEDLFINLGDGAYFWASDEGAYTQEQEDVTVTYKTAIFRQFAIYSSSIWRGTSRVDNNYRKVMYSVRLVRNAN